jgi:hypothetical protein
MEYKERSLVLFSCLWILWRDDEVSFPITEEKSLISRYWTIIDELSELHIFQYLSFLVFAILFTDIGFMFRYFSRVLKSEGITIILDLSRDGRYIAMHHFGNRAKRIFSLGEKELEFISF